MCRIHVTLDNFTIWCTAIVSASEWPLQLANLGVRDVVTVFSLSSIINIYIYLDLDFIFTLCPSFTLQTE